MNKVLIVIITILTSITLSAQDEITSLLPDPFNLPGMQIAGDAEIYKGDYLFDLINGGADVYFEYGFVQVVTQAYKGIENNSSLKIEIYEMETSDGAFGIFFLSAPPGQAIEQKGVFSVNGGSYKMIQKGSYFIMISFANLPEELVNSLVNKTSEGIEDNINELSNYPSLFTAVNVPCANYKRFLYFKGNIALRNATYLNFKIPFTYNDGIFYRCDVFDYIVFKPTEEKTPESLMQSLVNSILNGNKGYSAETESFGFSVKEDDKLKYDVRNEGRNIVLIKYI